MLTDADWCWLMLINAQLWFNWGFFCRSVPPELLRSFLVLQERTGPPLLFFPLLWKLGQILSLNQRLLLLEWERRCKWHNLYNASCWIEKGFPNLEFTSKTMIFKTSMSMSLSLKAIFQGGIVAFHSNALHKYFKCAPLLTLCNDLIAIGLLCI